MKKTIVVVPVLALGLMGLLAGPAAAANASPGGYAIVKGTILKETGNPLAHTQLKVGVGACNTPGGCGADSVVKVMTDAAGHYHARVLVTSKPNVYVQVPDSGPYESRTSAPIRISSGESYTKNLTVHKVSDFVGKIVDANGNPVSAVVAAYTAADSTFQSSDSTKSATGGYFHLRLQGGHYKVKLTVNNVPKGTGIDTTWYGSKTKDSATIVTIRPGHDQRAKIVFIP